ncbi:fatty-acyl-CoA synthase [Xylariomycetidae sp. FL2044]|nr:fatty-acyl-CoA synthase [Xylariomycetidae sp. FL2044]
MIKLMAWWWWRSRQNKCLVYNVLEERAATKTANHVFLKFEGRQWTFAEFVEALQPVGNWLMKELGVQKGEVVAVDGGNSPELMMLWFALEAIGATPAFINCNLTSKALVHCIKISGARYVLADVDVRDLVSPVEQELTDGGIRPIYYSPAFFVTLSDMTRLPSSRQTDIGPLDPSCLLFTSGTTGMPKAIVLTRVRELSMLKYNAAMEHLGPGSSMYTCLPLYHGTAHCLCAIPVIGTGATMVLSRKFSHKTFWYVHASKANTIQYVGELCRYLVNAPPSTLDRGHNVKAAWGNGMRSDVWDKFRERFGIEIIHELYAASDGMGSSVNKNRGEFSRYAIGVRGPLWSFLNGGTEKMVRIDPETQDIIRGPDGFAYECGTDEPGEALFKLNPKDPERGQPPYHNNKDAGAKRRVTDVFAKGDLWFRSGDLFRWDADGRYYFVDRLGDTFRWRSENVSTNEVSDVVGEFPQVAESNVYGVLVPNADGRAGCAAIVPRQGDASSLDWKGLAEHCHEKLPRYAVPVFVRVARQLEYTGTMKLQKSRLRSEGIDLDVVEKAAMEKGEDVDVMYWLPPGASVYVPFTKKDYQELKGGSVRL